jgi:tRNA(adenine34) deaminase
LISDSEFMSEALQLAQAAALAGEVPVGALVVQGERVIGRGSNRPISGCDPTAHAEVVALRDAAKHLGDYRLGGTTLYVTLEPCIMCAAALIHARVDRVVFGAWDPKAGGAGSIANVFNIRELNHRVDVFGGVLAAECGALLSDFFRARRQ